MSNINIYEPNIVPNKGISKLVTTVGDGGSSDERKTPYGF